MTRWFVLQSWFRRNGVVVALTVIACANLCSLFLLAQATGQAKQQQETNTHILERIDNVTSQIATESLDRTNQINKLNRHLDCIVSFFTQPDRTQKAISNINTCTISTAGSGKSRLFLPSNQAPQSSGSSQQSSDSSPKQNNSVTPSGGSSSPPFFTRAIDSVDKLLNALLP